MIQKLTTALLFILTASTSATADELTGEEEEFLSQIVDAVEQRNVDWIVEHSLQPMAITGQEDERILTESEYRKLTLLIHQQDHKT